MREFRIKVSDMPFEEQAHERALFGGLLSNKNAFHLKLLFNPDAVILGFWT